MLFVPLVPPDPDNRPRWSRLLRTALLAAGAAGFVIGFLVVQRWLVA